MTQGKSNDDVARELVIAAVRLVRWLRAADESQALTRLQTSALGAIIYSGGISPSALADLERVHRPTMTRVIAELVERGLITREKDPQDARGAILRVTDTGLEIWQRGQARTVAPLVERIAALPPREREDLERLLPIFLEVAEPPGKVTVPPIRSR
jgi:DNA-binding MarR family transcriptional regulator